MADLLSHEDLADFADHLVKIMEFNTARERDAYIQARSWAPGAEQ